MASKPFLYFQYQTSSGTIEPLAFSNPQKIWEVHTLDQIIPVLHEVQAYVKKGYYAAGYLSYEAAPAFDSAFQVRSGATIPLLWFAIFDEPSRKKLLPTECSFHATDWEPDIRKEQYESAIKSIHSAIHQGDTYQVNYTMRLLANMEGDPFTFYQKLSQRQRANYTAYLDIGRYQILSISPELFFHLEGNKITTKPMKGTAQRGRYGIEDQMIKDQLRSSEKERAENVMIVDLIRNDLGRIAKTGSVSVPKIFEVETYPTVHQMTSTVTAELSEKTGFVEILRALFPCGSITGAPKVSTMKWIANLEVSPREIYCGTIGYLTPKGEAIFNIPIRTVLIDSHTNKAIYGVGGGVTWDSTSEGEYEEAFSKARFLVEEQPVFSLLESIRLENANYSLLSAHMTRMSESAHYFGFPFDRSRVEEALEEFRLQKQQGVYKVRVLSRPDGSVGVEGEKIFDENEPVLARLAKEPIDSSNRFLFHKTTNREIYDFHRKQLSDDEYDVLLWNENGELTEFTIGNLVMEINGKKWTPKQNAGLLAGTFRQQLLERGEIEECHLTIDDLKKTEKIWHINSVRGWIEVQLII
ncbi:aminodeoxychorismate synthase component I [Risungbinella massiliensis]|uniref:aminodeoxychorismate synthase component I n=1 Tax=Risungbinella massiliensis TaxID=1329796 RepID=UPI0005CBD928|nr:aminodeoxychorismate synthase component I [Risungbinella massiliensis]